MTTTINCLSGHLAYNVLLDTVNTFEITISYSQIILS